MAQKYLVIPFSSRQKNCHQMKSIFKISLRVCRLANFDTSTVYIRCFRRCIYSRRVGSFELFFSLSLNLGTANAWQSPVRYWMVSCTWQSYWYLSLCIKMSLTMCLLQVISSFLMTASSSTVYCRHNLSWFHWDTVQRARKAKRA